jgi:hypothetical protein
MITADSNKKFKLCIMEFSPNVLAMAIVNKEAETVADAIYRECFSKFGILAQIHMDKGKEFVNKLSAELFQLLNVCHTKLRQRIRNAILRWKFSTKWSRNFCCLLLMTQL